MPAKMRHRRRLRESGQKRFLRGPPSHRSKLCQELYRRPSTLADYSDADVLKRVGINPYSLGFHCHEDGNERTLDLVEHGVQADRRIGVGFFNIAAASE